MIITRTPFRVSFFGGGTDYPDWYREHAGATLAMAIDKYCYISCRYLPPFFEHKSRIAYSKIETVASNDEIEHPAVRAVLNYMDIRDGVEIHYDADLPARTGLGTSSAFTVGLLSATHALTGRLSTMHQLASSAVHIEQQVLREPVGCQDQITAAYGGFSRIEFKRDETFEVSPVTLSRERLREFESHLMLVFTGVVRLSADYSAVQVRTIPNRKRELERMHAMVDEGLSLLGSSSGLERFGRLLDEAWRLKRSLTDCISSPHIDGIYEAGMEAGAWGGKLLGAGGGGFVLFFAPPERHAQIQARLPHLMHVPVRTATSGCQIVLYTPQAERGRVDEWSPLAHSASTPVNIAASALTIEG